MLRVVVVSAVAALAIVAILPTPAFADSFLGDLLGGLFGHGHGHGHHQAPAPLLAAGLPAFATLGGGAMVSRLRRRRAAQ